MFLLFYLIHNNRRTRSKPHDFHIPDNIDDFDDNIYLLTKFNELQINSANDTHNNFIKDETIQQQIKNYHIDINDEDEICNNPYFHSEEQDEFDIPDDI
ncbi:uncharacterized protein OCT59_026000 [Rhizophagus irregularis]|uniref:Uncharacterized protein n=1 Tax=Rhizophagus irregularis TaxID=588596 RepID=A0A915YWD6_9GLOM|nr:hypothetical protein OCT59_026000 [Rhizophagus irregularis]CAB5349991.1 unnamed protein product [Rhizophagus irregularis]